MGRRAAWDTIDHFLSSPFLGFHAERDRLARVVLPELEERLRRAKLPAYVNVIDLRVGVETAGQAETEARERQVLQVCLQEVMLCRPFFVLLLGDRYGTVMDQRRLEAAALEVGLEQAVENLSVTALEVEYGIFHALRHPAEGEKPRVWVYIRDALPYERMPQEVRNQYLEADAENAKRLQELKKALHETLPDRVRHYQASWDDAKQTVTGLDQFGRLIVEDLWRDLEEETRELALQGELTWQEQEQLELERFVARRSRVFLGRDTISQELLNWAVAPGDPSEGWARCLTGPPGMGKSSLFAHLHQQLAQRDNLLLLSHAAGISVRAGQVESMLRRWIGELAAFLGEPDPAPDDDATSPEDFTTKSRDEKSAIERLEQTFASLLGRVSDVRRVVVLIDALNQFEPTVRASYVTWLPKLWPENARFIASAVPGTASQALVERTGVLLQELPPLDRNDAMEIAKAICRQGHRDIAPEILNRLLEKRLPDGGLAAGNPLWLQLAVEELNLLDEEDFAQAYRDFVGLPGGEQLLQLRLRLAVELLPTVAELYGWLLKRSEQVSGEALARGFANLLAVSRAGLREADLRALLPGASGEPWDDLRFAVLRRSFLHHLEQQGAQGQWNFFHSQLREAVVRGNLTDAAELAALHTQIADHLQSLPSDDPLRQMELMVHLIGSDDRLRAARYYADLDRKRWDADGQPSRLGEAELNGATEALARHIVGSSECAREDWASAGLSWVVDLLDLNLDGEALAALCRNYRFALLNKLGREMGLDAQRLLAEATCRAGQRLASSDPRNPTWQRDLSTSHEKLGNLLAAEGNLDGALRAYRRCQEERLVFSDPQNFQWQRDLSVSAIKLGDVLAAQGDLDGALNAYRAGREIAETLASSHPRNTEWQRDLSVSHERLGDVLVARGDLEAAIDAHRAALEIARHLATIDPRNTQWQRDLLVNHEKLGDVLMARGDLDAALNAYRAGREIAERLASSDPRNAQWQRDLSASHNRSGNVLVTQGDLDGALRAYGACHQIMERLASFDPRNAQWQHDLALSKSKLGGVLKDRGDIDAALHTYQACHKILERLTNTAPPNAQWQRDLSASHNNLGDVLTAKGDLDGAVRAYCACHEILERLASSDPQNAQWQRDLSASKHSLGDVLKAQGDLDAALDQHRAGLEIRQRLASSDPLNAEWQRDLSVSYSKLGNVLVAQENFDGALQAYSACHEISSRLAFSDPQNVEWQRDLSASHHKLGEVLLAQRDLEGALRAYRACHEILERLASFDPRNAKWQRDLSASHNCLGNVLLARGDLDAALRAYQAFHEIAQRLAASDPLNAQWQRDLVVSHHKLARLYLKSAREHEADEHLRRCHELLCRMRRQGMLLNSSLRQLLQHLDGLYGEGA